MKTTFTREQAIRTFAAEYLRMNGLVLPIKSVMSIVENKLVETHNAFYMHGTHLRLSK